MCNLYLDYNAGAADDFAGFASIVDFAETCPFAELLVVVYLD